MSRFIYSFLVLFAVSFPVMTTSAWASSKMKVETVVITTSSGRHSFMAEIADTPAHRNRGLMFRKTLPMDQGMLFDNGEDKEMYMWMRNTVISLDMIFIAKDGTVVKVAKNTEPFSEAIISSGAPVRGVFEAAAGTADRIKLKPGDRVEHPIFR